MKHVMSALLIAASVSGCAITPNQESFAQEVLNGLRLGANASAGAFADVSKNRPRTQKTDCQPDYNGGFTCVTREQ